MSVWIKTNGNAVLTECSLEHPVNVANNGKFCSHILNVVGSWTETIFNTDSCVLVPSACRFNLAKDKTLAIMGFVKGWKLAQKFK